MPYIEKIAFGGNEGKVNSGTLQCFSGYAWVILSLLGLWFGFFFLLVIKYFKCGLQQS